MNDGIRILITGGTFDKHYDAVRGELTFKSSHMAEVIANARITVSVQIEINQLIDSLHMQDANRQCVLDACAKAPESRIVITHGTDTMVQTAALIGEARIGKTVVLTGAMVPYTVQGSDAVFNLGAAVAAVQILGPGVYIAMSGRVFEWDKVKKNREKCVFEDA
ncbi:MAG: asparaginase domain-containing protein [Spirochaetes bacterium]|nr:asparaginase domain-containing protein [Spirochaetota bacterium]